MSWVSYCGKKLNVSLRYAYIAWKAEGDVLRLVVREDVELQFSSLFDLHRSG